MKLNQVIEHNFTQLLSSGAFTDAKPDVQPMSLFKWRKLQQLARMHNVEFYIASGMKKSSEIDDSVLEMYKDSVRMDYSVENIKIYSLMLAKKFRRIEEEEKHNIDSSLETLEFLKLLVVNINEMSSSNINLLGLIAIGRYLRTKGDRIDFIKLNDWITELRLRNMSSLIASILIDVFGFDPSELEFLFSKIDKSSVFYDNLITHTFEKENKISLSALFSLSPVETIETLIGKRISAIVDIEE